MSKNFEDMTETEKGIHNVYFLITAHTEAILVLKSNGCAYSSQLVLMAEVRRLVDRLAVLSQAFWMQNEVQS